MKTLLKLTLLLFTLSFFQSCTKDEAPTPEPIAQPEPEPTPEPENMAPSTFTIELINEKNTAQLSWSAAIDPEGDAVTYKVILGDSLVSSQSQTSIELTDLLFEQEYQGKIIADDGNENNVEATFSFTTGFLWLKEYEQSNGAGNGYTYEYDANDRLTATIITSRNERSAISYDSQGRFIKYGDINYLYNSNGLITSITKDDGLADMSLTYNNEDKLNLVIINRTDPTTNYEARVTMTFFYDVSGNLEIVNRERRYSSDNTDGRERSFNGVNLKYDADDNMVEIVFTRSDDGETYTSDGTRQVFTYDTMKNPTYSLLINQIKLNAQIFLGGRGGFDPLNGTRYNVEKFPFIYNRSKHNTTNSKLYLSGELNFETNNEYEYNASGYPISARRTFNEDDSQANFPRWTYIEGN